MKLICCAAWLLAAAPAFAEGPAPAKAEEKKSEKSEEKDGFKVIHVKDLEALQKSDKRTVVMDANGQSFREDYGVIPGAKMLSSPSHFTDDELPAAKDVPLVFYCANSH